MIETVHPAKIPLRCWCQLLGALSEKDLLHRLTEHFLMIDIHLGGTPYLSRAKKISRWGIEPYIGNVKQYVCQT